MPWLLLLLLPADFVLAAVFALLLREPPLRVLLCSADLVIDGKLCLLLQLLCVWCVAALTPLLALFLAVLMLPLLSPEP